MDWISNGSRATSTFRLRSAIREIARVANHRSIANSCSISRILALTISYFVIYFDIHVHIMYYVHMYVHTHMCSPITRSSKNILHELQAETNPNDVQRIPIKAKRELRVRARSQLSVGGISVITRLTATGLTKVSHDKRKYFHREVATFLLFFGTTLVFLGRGQIAYGCKVLSLSLSRCAYLPTNFNTSTSTSPIFRRCEMMTCHRESITSKFHKASQRATLLAECNTFHIFVRG